MSAFRSHLQQMLAHCPFALRPPKFPPSFPFALLSYTCVAAFHLLSTTHAGRMRSAQSVLKASCSVHQRKLRRVLVADRHRRAPAGGQ